MQLPDTPAPRRRLCQTTLYFAAMMLFLVFSDWNNPGNVRLVLGDGQALEAVLLQETRDEIVVQIERPIADFKVGDKLTLNKSNVASLREDDNWVIRVFRIKWILAALTGVAVLWMVWRWFGREEIREWMANTWSFTKLLVPLLFAGVFAVGFLGRLLPESQVAAWVGNNGILSTLTASIVGCLFYFATLTEIPILQSLLENGMAQGPALALLLAGPALSLPSILVIRSVVGIKKTLVFTSLVIVMATVAGLMYGLAVEGGVL